MDRKKNVALVDGRELRLKAIENARPSVAYFVHCKQAIDSVRKRIVLTPAVKQSNFNMNQVHEQCIFKVHTTSKFR